MRLRGQGAGRREVAVKRKPKSHDEARRSHLALQARREAIARMRAGEVVDVRLATGTRPLIRARALGPDELADGFMVLAIINRRLRADWFERKAGARVGPRRLDYGDILGVVLLVDGESPYTPGSRQPPDVAP
jgi:hypothetical protein